MVKKGVNHFYVLWEDDKTNMSQQSALYVGAGFYYYSSYHPNIRFN